MNSNPSPFFGSATVPSSIFWLHNPLAPARRPLPIGRPEFAGKPIRSVSAEQQFKLALQEDPNFAEAHLNLANVYDDNGWYEDAEEEAKRAIEIFERTHETGVEGNTWQQSLSLAYTEMGATRAHQAASISDNDPLSALVNLKEALNDFKKAVSLDPANSKAEADLAKFKDSPILRSS